MLTLQTEETVGTHNSGMLWNIYDIMVSKWPLYPYLSKDTAFDQIRSYITCPWPSTANQYLIKIVGLSHSTSSFFVWSSGQSKPIGSDLSEVNTYDSEAKEMFLEGGHITLDK